MSRSAAFSACRSLARLVDDGDDGPAVEQRVGGGEPADPEARDEHAQAGPVGVAVGEVRGPVVEAGARSGHDAHDPLGVENPEPGATKSPAMIQNRITMVISLPPEQLEVVLERRHPEHPFAGES